MVIRPLEKKNQDKRFIKNWRPIFTAQCRYRNIIENLCSKSWIYFTIYCFFKSNCVCRKTVHQWKLASKKFAVTKICQGFWWLWILRKLLLSWTTTFYVFLKIWLWWLLCHVDKNIKWSAILCYKWRFHYSIFHIKKRCTAIKSKDNINGIGLYDYFFYLVLT